MNLWILIFFVFSLIFNNKKLHADVCEIPIIKNLKEIKEKVKICKPGSRILIRYDISVEKETLVANLCDFKYTIVEQNENSIIVKRNSGRKIVCIFNPSKKYAN
tara:strand:- start:390 stop:701 length:312 start_codon:yes stop_codon:yes gene_type:complete